MSVLETGAHTATNKLIDRELITCYQSSGPIYSDFEVDDSCIIVVVEEELFKFIATVN